MNPYLISVSVPEYTVKKKPDYLAIGAKLDKVIESNFKGRSIAVRGVGMIDHPGLKLDDFISNILKLGTDKYDLQRKGVSHEEFEPYSPDMHALPCTVTDSGLVSDLCKELPSVMAEVIKDFYEGARIDRGYPVRLDLLLIYDLALLERASKLDETKPRTSPHLEPYLFRFKGPARKLEALLGIVKILR